MIIIKPLFILESIKNESLTYCRGFTLLSHAIYTAQNNKQHYKPIIK